MANVQNVGVHKIPRSSPSDVSGIEELIDSVDIKPVYIAAIVAKTEFHMLVNDFSRGLPELSPK